MIADLIERLGAAFEFDVPALLDTLWLGLVIVPDPADGVGRATGGEASSDAAGNRATTNVAPASESPRDAAGGAETQVANGALFAGGATSVGTGVNVSPVRIPAGNALPNGLELLRALHILPARQKSRTRVELDEEGTVEKTAENDGRLTLQLRPQVERPYEAALVVEQTPSTEVWSDTIIDVERLLQHSGVFRDVRTYGLRAGPVSKLFNHSGSAVPASSLCDPMSGRIVFFFSTGLSESWNDGELGRVLERWGRTTPVVLLHALPQKMWKRTTLGEPSVLVKSTGTAAPNTALRRERAWWASGRPTEPRFTLPVFPLDRDDLQRWAEMLAARRGRMAPAFMVRTQPSRRPNAETQRRTERSAQERVGLFRANSSPEAFRLAVHLAQFRFTMPVARVVQASIFGSVATLAQVAEVVFSGLVKRVTPPAEAASPDEVLFAFEPAAGAVLLESLRDDDSRKLNRLLRSYVADNRGAPRELVAFAADRHGSLNVQSSSAAFGTLPDEELQRLGIDSNADSSIGRPSSPDPRGSKITVPSRPDTAESESMRFAARLDAIARRYMAPEDIGTWAPAGDELWRELQTSRSLLTIDFVASLLTSRSLTQRITGYFAFESNPDELLEAALERNLAVERELMETTSETRPLWRALHALDVAMQRRPLAAAAVSELRAVSGVLAARPDVDPGNQCRQLVDALLQRLGPAGDPRPERRRLLPSRLIEYLRSLDSRQTREVVGSHGLRTDLRLLAMAKLIERLPGKSIGKQLADGELLTAGLGDVVRLTDLGRDWVAAALSPHGADATAFDEPAWAIAQGAQKLVEPADLGDTLKGLVEAGLIEWPLRYLRSLLADSGERPRLIGSRDLRYELRVLAEARLIQRRAGKTIGKELADGAVVNGLNGCVRLTDIGRRWLTDVEHLAAEKQKTPKALPQS